MLLTRVLDGLFSAIPSAYYVYILVAVLTLVVTHAISQGRKTNRERDLHARIILVTVRNSYFRLKSRTKCRIGRLHADGSDTVE